MASVIAIEPRRSELPQQQHICGQIRLRAAVSTFAAVEDETKADGGGNVTSATGRLTTKD